MYFTFFTANYIKVEIQIKVILWEKSVKYSEIRRQNNIPEIKFDETFHETLCVFFEICFHAKLQVPILQEEQRNKNPTKE